MEKINYLGLPNCRLLTDGKVELIVTTDTGPRIMRFGFPGGKNMLGEWPDKKAVTKLGEFRLWGSERLGIFQERLKRLGRRQRVRTQQLFESEE